jgi:hypothetical protein
MMVIRSSQVPAASTTRTPSSSRRLSCSLSKSRRTEFPRCARSVPSCTLVRPGRSDCETTSLRELLGGWKVPLREQLAGEATSRW